MNQLNVIDGIFDRLDQYGPKDPAWKSGPEEKDDANFDQRVISFKAQIADSDNFMDVFESEGFLQILRTSLSDPCEAGQMLKELTEACITYTACKHAEENNGELL